MHFDYPAFVRFATALVTDLYTNFVIAGIVIVVSYCVRTIICTGILNAGVPVITKCPANLYRLFILTMPRQSPESNR